MNESTNFFAMNDFFSDSKSYETTKLKDFVSYYATKMSYQMVSVLAEERCGSVCISDQHIQEIVIEKMGKIGLLQTALITKNASLASPILCKKNIYSIDSEEVILMEDGVCVSQQKEHRDNIAKEGKERTTTNILLLQTPEGEFSPIVAAHGVDLTALVDATLKTHYSNKKVAIVVLSDGARNIKNRCQSLFAENYVHILDWYHLQKKVKELMTMIAPNKSSKQEYIAELNGLLWQGQGGEAIEKLSNYHVKNATKQQELIGYLEKNVTHIIDYKLRSSIGKTIGTGRMEKAGDIIIAKRQKEKGLSWSEIGSNAIAVLTAAYANLTTENLQ